MHIWRNGKTEVIAITILDFCPDLPGVVNSAAAGASVSAQQIKK